MFRELNRNLYNSLRRITTSGLYLPEVDGIRFISILWVVLAHIYGYYIAHAVQSIAVQKQRYPLSEKIIANGGGGVSLFFVLSGFILALPFARHYLLSEPPVQLKSYYIRRLTRIEPPYMLVMLLCFTGHVFLNPQSATTAFYSLTTSLLYAHNFFNKSLPPLNSPAWSLELEVQFYVIAPLLFRVFLLRRVSRRILLVTTMLSVVTIRYFFSFHFFSLYSCFEFFLAGIFLADIYATGTDVKRGKNGWIILSALSLLFILFQPLSFNYFLHYFTFPAVITFFFYTILRHPAIRHLFGYKWIPVIGGMCYSIYLLHYPIISFLGKYTTRCTFTDLLPVNLFLQLALLGLPMLLICALYYYFVERRFMRFGKRYGVLPKISDSRKNG
ncbi:acyltransferase family protein [Chitinophagaceae bacterium MMS25-I14]